jgi:regulator of nucleoside diphosphate kinase
MLIRSVYIAREDRERFFAMFERSRACLTEADSHLRALAFDMARAKTVPAREIPRNVVALYSWVRLRMSDTRHELTCQLVMPAEADPKRARISVLSPIGATIIGRRVGEAVIVESYGGRREVTVLGVFHHRRSEPSAFEDDRAAEDSATERRPLHGGATGRTLADVETAWALGT